MVSERVVNMRLKLIEQGQALTSALARIEHQATHDELTGLPNRRSAKRVLDLSVQRQRRQSGSLFAALLDLDHFKRINDTHGHAAGDEVLRCFAGALAVSLRGTDSAVRWGGEEFLVLLEPCTAAGVEAWLDRLRRAVAESEFLARQPEMAFTFSGGATAWRSHETIEAWLERADAGLYRAKDAGRNRVLVE